MFSYIKTLIDLYVPSVEVQEEEEGQGMVEYGLILALVAIVAAAVLAFLGDDIAAIFEDVRDQLGDATDGD